VRRRPQPLPGDNTTKTFTVNFSHTFDFTYAVYGRLYRALATSA
jgi:hypothetical protein